MSLDSSLRSALLSAGEPISVDPDRGLTEVSKRIRSAQRRRVSLRVVGALMLATTAVWLPRMEALEKPPYVPPAREDRVGPPRPEVSQKPAPPEGSQKPAPVRTETRNLGSERRPEVDKEPHGVARPGLAEPPDPPRSDSTNSSTGATSGTGTASPPPPSEVSLEEWSRVEKERYRVDYVAGTHVGENGGTGCWQGNGATESNDCMPFELAPGESWFSVQVAADNGVEVGARVYEYYPGGRTHHGVFCGSSEAIRVHPDAFLTIYIDTSAHCSDHRPTTGEVVVRFR